MGFLAILANRDYPVAIPYFFIGATAAVLVMPPAAGKARLPEALSPGSLIGIGPALIYPIMESVGLSGTSFPETDFVALGLVVLHR